MGIFPMSFEPTHSIGVVAVAGRDMANFDFEKRDQFFELLKTKFSVGLRLYFELDKMKEIDEWIGKNIKGKSYFKQEFPINEPVWMQIWYFDDKADAILFKLVWS